MRLTGLVVAVLALACGMPIAAFAEDAHYVHAADLSPQLLPPPPGEGSPLWQQQIQEVLAAQYHVKPADRAAMLDEQHMRASLLTDVIGEDFTLEKYPYCYAFLDHVLLDAEAVTGADKQFWHTRRPYLTDKKIKLLVDPIDSSPSYPSGHTSGSLVLAEVLGMLFPDHRDRLRAKADAIAQHRIEAGVHYPVDVEQGRMLAMLIVGAMIANDDFQTDLAQAKQELLQ